MMGRAFVILARVGAVLALVVVTVGAWVRLTDAGLGCPDWPGCYGRIIVTESLALDPGVGEEFGAGVVDTGKAWREMLHRYLASALGLICVALGIMGWISRRRPGQPWRMPLALVALVVFQGLLGMWTVTLLLKPIVVVAHLLGGFATLALLFWLGRWRPPAAVRAPARLRTFGVVATAVLVGQISLGGWTSANYAAVACPDFPTCQTQWWPAIADFEEAFVLWRGLGVDYEGGVLDHPARVAIHFTHRLGALITTLVVAAYGLAVMRRREIRADGAAVLIVLAAQLAAGIGIVVLGVPLSIAVAHNGLAAMLLLTLINANQRARQPAA